MFEKSKTFKINVPSGGDVKTCRLRFPTDEEWMERSRSLQTVRRTIGRGKHVMEAPNGEAVDARLFATIRIDENGQPFDDAEASVAVRMLDSAEVIDSAAVPEGYRITLSAFGMEFTHTMKAPLQCDVMEYGRSVVRVVDARRHQEIRISLAPARELYAKLVKSATGYTTPDDVPVTHKDAVVTELLSLMEQADVTIDPE